MSSTGSKTRKSAAAHCPEKQSVALACVTQSEIAEVLGVVARQVRNLEKDGLPREVDGYPIARCVRWYVEFKQAEAVQRTQPRELSSTRSEAEDRKAIADAVIAEVRARRELEQVVDIASFDAELRRVLYGLRREINNLVGMLAPDILHITELAEARRIVRLARDELLRRLQKIADATPEGGES